MSRDVQAHTAFATGYRADIDGLRAIAVVAVILFHAHFSPFSGGFVGVDVFFVISGFLITSIIKKEVDRNQFSIARFYERRIRRIFPALFFLLLGITPLALFVLLPIETARYRADADVHGVVRSQLVLLARRPATSHRMRSVIRCCTPGRWPSRSSSTSSFRSSSCCCSSCGAAPSRVAVLGAVITVSPAARGVAARRAPARGVLPAADPGVGIAARHGARYRRPSEAE